MADVIEKPERMTSAHFLEWSLGQSGAWELRDGVPVKLMATSDAHDQISGNIYAQFHNQLRGKKCSPRTNQLALRIREGVVYEPDGGVDCGRSENQQKNSAYIEPKVIVEVMSPSTEKYDKNRKLPNYLKLETVDYVLYAEQEEMYVMTYSRTDYDSWLFNPFSSPEDIIRLPKLDLTLKLADIYEGVTFPES